MDESAAWVILFVLALRIVYLIWLSPWELVGDEAYYWEWSRHLDWCYYEKGPGQAFLIAPFIKLFGVREWAVRMPMALLSAATAWVLGRLAVSVSGTQRAGLLAVILFCITPAFSANAQLCTQDGPIILIWAALSACGLKLIRRWETGGARLWDWVTPAIWLGIGLLFKQSILLFGSSIVVYALLRRKHLVWNGRLFAQVGAATIVVACFAAPMLVWNARHGWPTLAHTLGHLGAGGDHGVDEKSSYSPVKWFFSLLGAEIGAFGPALLLLGVLSCIVAIRTRGADNRLWTARLWMICCALPSIAFFTALSLGKEVLGNWPFPSFVTVVVLAADFGAQQWQRSRDDLKTPFAKLWKLAKWYGVIGCLVIAIFPTLLVWIGRVPFLKKGSEAQLMKMTGHRQHAREIQAARDAARASTDADPMIVARYYMIAALDAFYLEDHPTVFCAGTAFGKRPTAFDFWSDTDLTQSSLRGQSALLDKQNSPHWGNVLMFERMDESGNVASLGTGFGGIRAKANLSSLQNR